MKTPYDYRIGIDLGGTKIEVAALAHDGTLKLRQRIPTPQGYDATVAAMAELVRGMERQLGGTASVGVGIPGVISPATGLVKNANSIALNGHPFDREPEREERAASRSACQRARAGLIVVSSHIRHRTALLIPNAPASRRAGLPPGRGPASVAWQARLL